MAGAIVNVRLAVFVCCGLPESFTWKVRAALFTALVGVPVMEPVEALSDRPAGSEPLMTDQVNGVVPPVAANVAL